MPNTEHDEQLYERFHAPRHVIRIGDKTYDEDEAPDLSDGEE